MLVTISVTVTYPVVRTRGPPGCRVEDALVGGGRVPTKHGAADVRLTSKVFALFGSIKKRENFVLNTHEMSSIQKPIIWNMVI